RWYSLKLKLSMNQPHCAELRTDSSQLLSGLARRTFPSRTPSDYRVMYANEKNGPKSGIPTEKLVSGHHTRHCGLGCRRGSEGAQGTLEADHSLLPRRRDTQAQRIGARDTGHNAEDAD